MLGFPIRTSSDPRSVGSSPRHIAASHVLHRLLMPRHPPCALKHLQHKKPEKEKRNCTSNTHNNTPTNNTSQSQRPQSGSPCVLDARNHYPQIKHHTPPPKQGDNSNRLTPNGARTAGNPLLRRAKVPLGLLSQSPIVCLAVIKFVCCCTRPPPTTGEGHPTNRPMVTELPHDVGGPGSRGAP